MSGKAVCEDCGEPATYKFEKVLPIVDPAKDVWGLKAGVLLCETHAGELVRTTTERWEITPLFNPPRKKTIDDQLTMDV